MNLNNWFNRGITKEEYMTSLEKHRDSFMNIYHHFKVPQKDMSILQEKKNIRAIVLAEVWCGHCMLDIPILLHITEQANIPIRFLPRDQNLELMDNYLTNEKRIIPIVIFIDDTGKEIAKWGPIAPKIASYVHPLKENLPAKDSPEYEEAFRTFAHEISDSFSKDKTLWNYVYEDMKNTLLS